METSCRRLPGGRPQLPSRPSPAAVAAVPSRRRGRLLPQLSSRPSAVADPAPAAVASSVRPLLPAQLLLSSLSARQHPLRACATAAVAALCCCCLRPPGAVAASSSALCAQLRSVVLLRLVSAITVHPLLPCAVAVCGTAALGVCHHCSSAAPARDFGTFQPVVSDLLFFSDLLICNMSANAIVVNIVLDGHNYPEWVFCVQTALRGHGLHFHLTEDSPILAADRSNAAAIKTWQINDGKVIATMVNSTKPTMIMSLSKFTTAKAIWSHLKDRFVQDSGALLHTLMQQTHMIEQHDMSIDEYYSAFDRLMSALTSMVPALSELLAEETRLKSMSSLTGVSSHSVLAAAQRSRNTSFQPCEHCKKTTHRSENCFAKFPEKLADFRVRRATRGRGMGPSPKGSVAVAATSSAGASSSSWVLDSGASFHVTSDQSRLASTTPVTEGTSVQAADGTLCHVTHKGSLSDSNFTVPNIFFVPELSMDLLSVG
jgi:hypothetical protein